MQNTEAVSTSWNESKGEDMDACLEEKNKESKVWQHGTMTALDWLRIFRNLGNLSNVQCMQTFVCFTFWCILKQAQKIYMYLIYSYFNI